MEKEHSLDLSDPKRIQLNTSKEEIIKHNLEWVVKDCVEQFEKQKIKVIVIHIDQKFFDEFRKKLLNFYNNGLVFITVSGDMNIEIIQELHELYKNKKIVIYDRLRKIETHWKFNLPEGKEKRKPYTHIDADYYLSLNRFYY